MKKEKTSSLRLYGLEVGTIARLNHEAKALGMPRNKYCIKLLRDKLETKTKSEVEKTAELMNEFYISLRENSTVLRKVVNEAK